MSDLSLKPFRPRAARVVGWVMAALVLSGVIALEVLGATGVLPVWRWVDRIGSFLFFGAGLWLIWRQATVAAIPSERGLKVRNLVLTRHLTWEEIVMVSFARGRPWAHLNLSDGSTLAVMGIQGADGEYAVSEARRLAELVSRHEGLDRD
ncbi:MAG TPA: PH domain-containing protein [Actinomycetales bacterium]|nr:PH domain-containing protein [Actinomycetales bacterium]